jgi:hypothetical protein
MLGVLGLLTSWLMLAPLIFVLYLRLGGPYFDWMAPLAGLAISVPVLGFSTIGGIALMIWSIRQLTRPQDPF